MLCSPKEREKKRGPECAEAGWEENRGHCRILPIDVALARIKARKLAVVRCPTGSARVERLAFFRFRGLTRAAPGLTRRPMTQTNVRAGNGVDALPPCLPVTVKCAVFPIFCPGCAVARSQLTYSLSRAECGPTWPTRPPRLGHHAEKDSLEAPRCHTAAAAEC